MKIGLLQFKPIFGKVKENIKSIENLQAGKEFDLLVLPELANSGYLFASMDEVEALSEFPEDGIFCNALKNISAKKNAHVVSGFAEKADEAGKMRFYNSSILIYPDGRYYIYRKIHLFYEEKLWFSPGNIQLEVHSISGRGYENVGVGMMICFDWFFPETARTLALRGAQIICHSSNLVMPYCQKAMPVRALENHVFTVTSNRIGKEICGGKEMKFTGGSVILNPKGDYLFKGSQDKEELAVIEIDPAFALNKNINSRNNIFKDRRSEFYEK
jgi:predicted amidohydrolase